ncbi:hypothetical protein Ga0061061_11746 [Chelatococcus sambhunathii]|uniref:Tail tubular protein B n=1 Tax=Chelatococcus sambhunathii TaxID=363953 RepID=A0ABM9UII7_9HYPH|nr:hypothetical protein [Chelatococcus sambhunathii]CUA91006.1 hypothetical protein Ga0061061_11746 [Chelatococcus sambhunathii]
MAVISGSVPNLINGVSQQPFALRLASQAEAQVNGYSSVVEGLTKRPPTKHVARIMGALPAASFVHIINRDVTERYVVVAVDGDLKVFDLAGNEKVVNFPAGKGYLSSARCNFSAVTVADYTFFLNRDMAVAMTEEIKPARGNEAILYFRQGTYAATYTVTIDALDPFTFTTSTTDPAEIQTNAIATRMAGLINANEDFQADVYSSTLHVRRKDGGPFEIKSGDSIGDTAIVCVTKQTQSYVDLPGRAVHGYQCEITGAPGNVFDNYWLEYDASGTGGNDGVWREIAAPGRKIAFDGGTMPHTLVRNGDGTFTFAPAEWAKCGAGSDATTPKPSFVGKTINDIFFYRNRLGFIADEAVIFSRSSAHFNFWRETATQVLDTDPIDVATSHVKVSILRHAVPFNESLLLFSDQTQFMLGASEALTPGTVSLDQVTEFETSPLAKPVGAGSFVYFCTLKGDFTGVREYYLDGVSKTNNANDVTNHVPRYVAAGVFKLAASTNEDILIALSSEKRDTIFVYKFYYSGQEKVQSSWSVWTLDAGCEILNAEFIENTLWLVIKRSDGVYLERMDIEAGKADAGLPYVVHLDRRLTETQVQSLHFDGSTTSFDLPYTESEDGSIVLVSRPGDATYRPGVVVPFQRSGSTLTVKGNLTHFYVGVRYALRYTFSPLLVRLNAAGGGQIANTEGRIQLRRALLNYADTGYFRVHVTPFRRPTFRYPFTGRIVGSGRNLIGEPTLETGSFRFPIMANNMGVEIVIVNDTHLPSRLLNLDWEALYTVRTQRMN